jgi:hypothetical protein
MAQSPSLLFGISEAENPARLRLFEIASVLVGFDIDGDWLDALWIKVLFVTEGDRFDTPK